MNAALLMFALLAEPSTLATATPEGPQPADKEEVSKTRSRPRRRDLPRRDLNGTWQVRGGLGEIPVLAGSFKPAIDFGYHFNDYVYVGGMIQFQDRLERNGESWNAARIGFEGLRYSRERTGVRVFAGTRLRPHRFSPYLSAGVLFNGTDAETMRFDDRSRTIGEGTYTGSITIEQRRPYGIRPAVGLGYSLELKRGLSLGLEFTGAWFFKPATPDVEISLQGTSLSQEDEAALRGRITQVFADNWHNRYHFFLITVGYTF